MAADTKPEMAEYAEAAGLQPQDMPSSHHPLMQDDEEIRNLSDLIEVRDDRSRTASEMQEIDDSNLDISDALTFPHKKQSDGDTAIISDFDADALTSGRPDDEDDASYMTRADVEAAMDETDPDPNTGAESGDFIAGAGLDRAPDITGTVTGIARGMATHLPQDLGADGFQIEEPESLGDSRVTDEDIEAEANTAASEDTGHRIPTTPVNPDTRDDSLDATRQLK